MRYVKLCVQPGKGQTRTSILEKRLTKVLEAYPSSRGIIAQQPCSERITMLYRCQKKSTASKLIKGALSLPLRVRTAKVMRKQALNKQRTKAKKEKDSQTDYILQVDSAFSYPTSTHS